MKKLTRRDFVKTSALAMASLKLASTAKPGAVENEEPAPQTPRDGVPRLRWLGDNRPALHAGSAWGTPWPKGTHPAGASFRLKSSNRKDIPIQSWPMAYWPDGSLKWTGHAIAGDSVDIDGARIESGDSIAPGLSVVVKEYRDHFEVDTGVIVCQIPRSGNNVIDSIVRSGRTIAGKGRLKALCCNSPDMVAGKSLFHKPYEGRLDSVTLEQSGPVRAVLKLSGWHHSEDGRRWLPFDLRLYFHAGGEAVRLVHTFVFDGDEQNDFISGLGIEFEVPLREESYNRHIRFAGENGGLWAEAVKGITGLRRDPGEKVRAAQLAGKPTPPLSEWWSRVTDRLHWIPEWGDFTLAQPSANAFTIRKRTKEGHAWIPAGQGKRSAGLGYVGDTSGGLAFGIRDFWQAHPSQLDIRDAQTDCARATLGFGRRNLRRWICAFITMALARKLIHSNWMPWISLMRIMSRASAPRTAWRVPVKPCSGRRILRPRANVWSTWPKYWRIHLRLC